MPRQTRRSIYKTPPSTTPKTTRSKKAKQIQETEIEESFVIDPTPSENIDEINENEKQIEKTVDSNNEEDSSSDENSGTLVTWFTKSAHDTIKKRD